MAGGTPPQKPDGVSVSGSQLTISLSAIIASIWAGIWGFNWAASHLDGAGLFVAIIIGLAVGAVLTFRFVERAFNSVDTVEQLYYRAVAQAAASGHDPTKIPPPGVILKQR